MSSHQRLSALLLLALAALGLGAAAARRPLAASGGSPAPAEEASTVAAAAAASEPAAAPAPDAAAAEADIVSPYGSAETDACIQLTNTAGQACTVESDTRELRWRRQICRIPAWLPCGLTHVHHPALPCAPWPQSRCSTLAALRSCPRRSRPPRRSPACRCAAQGSCRMYSCRAGGWLPPCRHRRAPLTCCRSARLPRACRRPPSPPTPAAATSSRLPTRAAPATCECACAAAVGRGRAGLAGRPGRPWVGGPAACLPRSAAQH